MFVTFYDVVLADQQEFGNVPQLHADVLGIPVNIHPEYPSFPHVSTGARLPHFYLHFLKAHLRMDQY